VKDARDRTHVLEQRVEDSIVELKPTVAQDDNLARERLVP
jgi:hypothetical protein